jgi:hypothetical protein
MRRDEFIKAAPLTQIHLINLIDSAEMRLMDPAMVRLVLQQFVETVDSKVASLDWVVGESFADGDAAKTLKELIQLRNVDDVSIHSIDGQFPEESVDGARTVTVWAGFEGRNRAAIELLENSSDLSPRLTAPPHDPAKNSDPYKKWLWQRAELLLNSLKSGPGYEFVPKPKVTIWIAPNGGEYSAVELRHKLGLDHLPRSNTAEDQLMVALAFDTNGLAGLLRRPYMIDNPGHRFRARTNLDFGKGGNLPHGMTVDISNQSFDDGLPELVFHLNSTFRPVAQTCWPVGFITLDKSMDEAHHTAFAQQLLRKRTLENMITQALAGVTP